MNASFWWGVLAGIVGGVAVGGCIVLAYFVSIIRNGWRRS